MYDYLQTQPHVHMKRPCTVFHVRRADAALALQKNDITRRYHAIEEYINVPQVNVSNNILLLTDDHNAVSEALYKFPNINWMYLDKKRHHGAEGGFENQIPSGDPVTEVVAILTEFALAKKCDSIVHTLSSYAYLLRALMQSNVDSITAVDMDDKLHELGQVFTKTHRFSVNISRTYDAATV